MTDLIWDQTNPICTPRDICAVHQTAAEFHLAVLAFARLAIACGARVALAGLGDWPAPPDAANGQVIVVPVTGPRVQETRHIVREGQPVEPYHAPPALSAANATPSSMQDGLLAMQAAALADGFRGLWLVADGQEVALTRAALAMGLTVLCLYDAALVPGNQMLQALQRHTHILIDGEISENEHYLPPADDADPDGSLRFAGYYQRMRERRLSSNQSLATEHAVAALVSDAIALVEIRPDLPARMIEMKGSIGGYAPVDLFNHEEYIDLVHVIDRTQLVRFYQRMLNGENAEVDFRLKDPTATENYTWVRLAGRGLRIDGNGTTHLYLAARDIDWRKRTELELAASYTALGAAVTQLDQANSMLREKQRQLDLLLNQAPVQIWTTDRDLVFISSLGAKDRDWAYKPGPMLGKPATHFFSDDSPVLDSHYAALQGETSSFHLSIGGRYYLAQVEPLRDPQGDVVGVIGVVLDITEQQQAEEALLLTQAFNRSLLDASIDDLILLDRNGVVLALNGSAAANIGRPVEALIGFPLVDQLSADVGQTLLNDLSSVITSHKTLEHTAVVGDHTLRVRFDPIDGPQGEVAQVALLVQDITGFLQAEQAERSRREVAEILRSVSEDLTRTTHRQQVLDVVLEGVRWLAPDLSAHVLMLKEGLAFMESFFQNSTLRSLSDLRQLPPLPVEGLIDLRTMYKDQQPVLFADVRDEPEWVIVEAMDWIRSYAGAPIVIGSTVVGFITLASDQPNKLNDQHIELIQALAGQAAVALQKAQMFTDLEEKNQALAAAYNELEEKNQALAAAYLQVEEKNQALAAAYNELEDKNLALTAAYDATIAGWARALELRDKETEGHSQRVVALTMRLVERLNVPASEYDGIRWGALLHDIGKMGIPDKILLKSDQPLTDQEWMIMKLHPTLAYNMLVGIEYLRSALTIPYSHHEWWDGTGYPLSLKGEAIPLAARIFSVVDAWDALTNQRPYRPAWSPWRVARHIRALAGRQFDPRVVDEFLKMQGYEQ